MSLFSSVQGLRPGRSLFDLSYEKKFTAEIGTLIPIMAEEVVPGDSFTIGSKHVVRWNPLVAPIMQRVDVKKWCFFVPYRLLTPIDASTGNSQWETFITGGLTGPQSPDVFPTMPNLNHNNHWLRTNNNEIRAGSSVHGLLDYFGFPLTTVAPPGLVISAFPLLAYKLIVAEYFKDEDLDSAIINHYKTGIKDGTIWSAPTAPNYLSLTFTDKVTWRKDYFTSARPFQQRGISPALPIGGDATVDFSVPQNSILGDIIFTPVGTSGHGAPVMGNAIVNGTAGGGRGLTGAVSDPDEGDGLATRSGANFNVLLGNNHVDLSNITSVDINGLRTAVQLQKWMERNARAGVRYTEFLRAHFGVAPSDARLQRPEFIGATVDPLIFSEVLQTSQSTSDDPSLSQSGSPQGNLAGHGIGVANGFIGKYQAKEYGVIITLMSVVPRRSYQQGINRQWLRQTRFDYFFPEFAHLSEQGIYRLELFPTTSGTVNAQVFGFTERYNEMRFKPDIVCGQFRSKVAGGLSESGDPASLDYWHMSSAFAAAPVLNGSFVGIHNGWVPQGGETALNRVLAVPSEPAMLVTVGNLIRAARPLPRSGEPGMLDHF